LRRGLQRQRLERLQPDAERHDLRLRLGIERHVQRIHRIHHSQPGHQRRLGKRRRIRLLIAPARVTLTIAAALVALTGCGGSDQPASGRHSVETYLSRVEPVRLGVNRLLEEADPILAAYREHRLTPSRARSRMNALERRFAAYATRIAAVRSVPASLRAANRAYAHTYVLEDSYLSALAAALPEREFDDLPDTQARQRAAITGWRIRLEVVAHRLGIRLPMDIQAAGRGEIAPSPVGD
jgi:hypothetical protein